MKTTILSIAAAAAITLGTAGAATAATPTVNAGLFEGAETAKTQTVRHRGYGYRYGYGYRHRRMCRRLRYRGFVLGDWRARRLYYRLCRYRRPYYRYGY
jgi:hypothetical protein